MPHFVHQRRFISRGVWVALHPQVAPAHRSQPRPPSGNNSRAASKAHFRELNPHYVIVAERIAVTGAASVCHR